MGIQFGKFLHTQTGKIVMSILLGFGLASLFRTVCKNNNCLSKNHIIDRDMNAAKNILMKGIILNQ